MNIGVIVQARTSSTRLPGKVLHEVQGKPMLQYTLERLSHCRRGMVVVATSDAPGDEAIVDLCRLLEVPCHVGPLENVARRFVSAVEEFGFDCFARISGDSPLIDQRIVDRAIDLFTSNDCIMTTNIRERTFPKGQSVEVLDSEWFLPMVEKMTSPDDREHVTPYFYRNLGEAEMLNFTAEGPYGDVQHAVDTAEDMAWFENVVAVMTRPHWEYSYLDILNMDGGN